MRSAERQPSSSPIDGYVRSLAPDLCGAFWTRRRIVAELTDHLLETTARFEGQGMARSQAEERAIEDFGSPRFFAVTFASSKGLGVPTTFTRYSGLAAALGSLIVTIAFIWQEFSIEFMQGFFAEISTVGGALVAIAMFGIYFRSRSQLGPVGRVGFRLTFAGFVIGFGSAMFWFGPGAFLGLLIMLVGVFTYFGAVLRSDVLPAGFVGILLAGIGCSLFVGLAGELMGVNTGPVAMTSGTILMTIGMAGIGRFLWSEKPVPQVPVEPGLPA